MTRTIKAQDRQKGRLSQLSFLLGLSCDEFYGHTAVPWNEAGLCGLLKETPAALPDLFSKR
jgi:hypothetical protein